MGSVKVNETLYFTVVFYYLFVIDAPVTPKMPTGDDREFNLRKRDTLKVSNVKYIYSDFHIYYY